MSRISNGNFTSNYDSFKFQNNNFTDSSSIIINKGDGIDQSVNLIKNQGIEEMSFNKMFSSEKTVSKYKFGDFTINLIKTISKVNCFDLASIYKELSELKGQIENSNDFVEINALLMKLDEKSRFEASLVFNSLSTDKQLGLLAMNTAYYEYLYDYGITILATNADSEIVRSIFSDSNMVNYMSEKMPSVLFNRLVVKILNHNNELSDDVLKTLLNNDDLQNNKKNGSLYIKIVDILEKNNSLKDVVNSLTPEQQHRLFDKLLIGDKSYEYTSKFLENLPIEDLREFFLNNTGRYVCDVTDLMYAINGDAERAKVLLGSAPKLDVQEKDVQKLSTAFYSIMQMKGLAEDERKELCSTLISICSPEARDELLEKIVIKEKNKDNLSCYSREDLALALSESSYFNFVRVYSMVEDKNLKQYLLENHDMVHMYKNLFLSSYVPKEVKDVLKYVDSGLKTDIDNSFKGMVSKEQLNRINLDKLKLFSSDLFLSYKFGIDEHTAGYNSEKETVINIDSKLDLKITLVHEYLHEVSRSTSDYSITGFRIEEKYRGINEATTQFLSEYLCKENDVQCGYTKTVAQLRRLVDGNVIDFETLSSGYFGNDINGLKKELDSLGGIGTFDQITNLMYTVNEDKSKDRRLAANDELDKLVTDLVIKKAVQ